MFNVLSLQQYQEIKNNLSYPNKAFINGQYVSAQSGKHFETKNPATEEVLASIAACDDEDLDIATKHARAVFESGTWAKMLPSQRKAILQKWVSLIEENIQELSVLESIESGKPISEVLNGDMVETVTTLSWYAEAADKYYNQMTPTQNGSMGLIEREPIGVVATVLPWNFPLWMMAWKAGPALAAGNSLIVKPAEDTSFTALKVAELAKQAGIPDGVFNVLPGLGETIGRAIGEHPDIDVVSFTGSTEVGRLFLEYSAKSNLKNVVLECGGKSPSVVLSDAKNLDHIAEHVVNAFLWNMGQNCTANSRLIVHKNVKAALLSKIIEKAKTWKIGEPLDPSNQLGAMISAEHFDKVMGYINQGTKEGATLLFGGKAVEDKKGFFILPTIFDNVRPDMAIAKEEIFGPVLAVMEVNTDDEAIQLANATEYGLQASVYACNTSKALKAARTIKAGSVSINCYSEGDITAPFGGFKLSGFGGKDKSLNAFEQYTQSKCIWVDLS